MLLKPVSVPSNRKEKMIYNTERHEAGPTGTVSWRQREGEREA